ncbi:MAG: N-sulfoglucosamine sulfohydrolase [Kiritimatiellia bacterium]|jgi:N-sulfoglucosamine sulfohydrolase
MKALTILLLCALTCPLSAKNPNLLFIIADDCTHNDIGCYGGQALTPHMDQLATEGMRFTQCFQAAPMCSPTRHTIYTGLYPVKSGAYPNHTFAKEGTKSVVHYLKPLGYRVALSGKTHIGPKEVFPFEFSSAGNNPDMAKIDTLMSECKEADQPWCLFACSNEPHSPWDKGDPTQYDAATVKLPPYFVDTPETRADFVKYLAEITYYDGQVGQLLALLKQHGIAEETLVIVTSEQGSGFAFAKWTCYDMGLQSACIARWPGTIKAGQTSDALIEFIDVLPTFVEAAGGTPDPVLEGKSLLPVFRGETDHHKDHVYGIMTTRGIINGSDTYGIRSVRSDRFKLIVNLTPDIKFTNACSKSKTFQSWVRKAEAGDADAADKVRRYHHRPAVELYDVKKDWYEWKNLADHPEYAEVKAELQAKLDAWMKQQGDLGQETELAAREHQHRGRKKK